MYPLIELGPFRLHTYTICMVTAALLVGWLTWREAKRRGRLDENTLAAASLGMMGGVLGAKLSMLVFLGPADFWRALPTLPSHGAAISGGLIGGYLATVVGERLLNVDRCSGDLVAPFLPLGQAIGRLGNFMAGDAYGSPSSLPWAITVAGTPRHPAALYELGLDLLLCAGLVWYRGRSFRDGELFRLYAVGYALIRFPIEFVRYQPTPRDLLGLTLVQWLCIAAVIGFGYQLWLIRRGVACVCALVPRWTPRRRMAATGK